MSNAVATRGDTALTIHPGQTEFNEAQVATLAQLGMDRANRGDLAVFFHQAVRTGLDPFARQIYMIERQGKQTIQTGIDGFRLIARRAVNNSRETFGYEDTLWCGPDGQWTDVWLSKDQPAAAKVTVVRNGERFPAVALFDEYAGRKRDGGLMQMWATKGALMLAKCAEALALRKAFPQDLSGLYTSDEMQQADYQGPSGPARPDAPASQGGGSRIAQARQRAQSQGKAPSAPSPAQAAEPEAPADEPSEPMCDRDLWNHISKALDGLDVTTPDDKLAAVSDMLGRRITRGGEMTAAEAHGVLSKLDPTVGQDDAVEAEIVDEADAA
ncbi:RecT family recombinase [Citricoccus sp. K5]|uniref:RecT family recombinase n=1 Tax=Citricoccus sp. K5 TaxID=2653135 RepID=UPI0012F288C5|nr:RecT family recombinase [Citricoccus sp. K5]VXA93394.1 Phage recombination protein Bet [Citricoccus sp. K5]VXA96188.1 Phage recombination protein Bet [Citricoccus sp. K5]